MKYIYTLLLFFALALDAMKIKNPTKAFKKIPYSQILKTNNPFFSKKSFGSLALQSKPFAKKFPKQQQSYKTEYTSNKANFNNNQGTWNWLKNISGFNAIKNWLYPNVEETKNFSGIRFKQAKNLYSPQMRYYSSDAKENIKKEKEHLDAKKYANLTKDEFKGLFEQAKKPKELRNVLLLIIHPDAQILPKETATRQTQRIYEAYDEFIIGQKRKSKQKKTGSSNKTVEKESEEEEETPANQDFSDNEVKETISHEWIKTKISTDKHAFNRANKNKYRDYDANNPINYYEIEIDLKTGAIKESYKLRYNNEKFTPTSESVPTEISADMINEWMEKEMLHDMHYFNKKYDEKQRNMVYGKPTKYYELTLDPQTKKITSVVLLKYWDRNFIPTEETITKDVYQKLMEKGFFFNDPKIKIETDESALLYDKMISDIVSFNKKHNDKFRWVYGSKQKGYQYYQLDINTVNGTPKTFWRLVYEKKNDAFIPLDTNVSDTYAKKNMPYKWLTRQIDSDKDAFNKKEKHKHRLLLGESYLADIVGNYYEITLNPATGMIQRAVELKYMNGKLAETNNSVDVKIYKQLHLEWLKSAVENDKKQFNNKNKDKIRVDLSIDPLKYYEAHMNIKDGSVKKLLRLMYLNGEFVESLERVSSEEYKEVLKFLGKSYKPEREHSQKEIVVEKEDDRNLAEKQISFKPKEKRSFELPTNIYDL